MNLLTTTGEGRAIVQCDFSVDSDGDIEDMQVMFNGVNIIDALTEEQRTEIESQCLTDYLATCEDEKAEAAWERKQEREIDQHYAELQA